MHGVSAVPLRESNREHEDPIRPGTVRAQNDIQFVDLRIHRDDEPVFTKWWQDSADDVFEYLNEIVDTSYRLTVKFDYHNACYQCSVTQSDPKGPNAGKCMISRAPDVELAVAMTIYKIVVLTKWGEWPIQQSFNNWG